MSEWISVKERLPEGKHDFMFASETWKESDFVLLYVRCKDEWQYGIGQYIYYPEPEYNDRWYGYTTDETEIGRDDRCIVTHWMPLPEPPAGGLTEEGPDR